MGASSPVKICWTEDALADVEEAVDWLEVRNPRAAARLLGELFGTIKRLGRGDLEGSEAVLSDGTVVRSWPVAPMRVYYERRDGALWVLRIRDQRMRPITRSGT